MGSRKKFIVLITLAALNTLGLFLNISWSKTAITFLEYSKIDSSESEQDYNSLHGEASYSQDFVMPYEIFHSISLRVNDFERDNNSTYNLSLKDSGGKEIFSQDFIVSLEEDSDFYEIVSQKNIRVEKGANYSFTVTAKNVAEDGAVGFYKNAAVYGGDYRFWWTGFAIFISVFLYLVLARIAFLINSRSKNKSLKKDPILLAMLVFGLILALSSVFSVQGGFLDEGDNIQGGMAISDGAVIYRDYVSQHTPLAYYICALFAHMGAESLTQFRLMFYILGAIGWALVYLRYSEKFGRGRILLLAVAFTCLLPCMYDHSSKIITDNIQAFFIIALLFEFISYCKEGLKSKLGWVRSLIVAVCVYGSVGVAFVSIYALSGFFIAFLVMEVKYWRGIKEKMCLSKLFLRYYRLLILLIVPAVIVVAYFLINSAISPAIEQAYSFNTEVYSKYLDGYGSKLMEPFLNGIKIFLFNVRDEFLSIAKLDFDYGIAVRAVVLFPTIYVILRQFKERKVLIPLLLISVICFSATRDTGFHSLPAWAVMLFVSIVFWPKIKMAKIKGWQWLLIIATGLFLFASYFAKAQEFLLYNQPSVSRLENYVVSATNEGDYIAVDGYIDNSLYYHYRNRRVANRNLYILPWYMDWYEDSVIKDMEEHDPAVVIYNPDSYIWGHQNFSPRLASYIESNYHRDSPNDVYWVKG